MPAENILFPRPCYEGMISTSLEVIWEISVQALRSTEGKVAYFGDSVVQWVEAEEPPDSTLPDLLSAKTSLEVVDASKNAEGTDLFEEKIRFLGANAIRPSWIVLPINLRMFSPLYEFGPRWNFALRGKMLRTGRYLPWRFLAVFKYKFGRMEKSEWYRIPIEVAGGRVGTLREIEGLPLQTRDVPPEYLPNRYLGLYATDIDKSSRVESLERILDLLLEHEFAHVVYLTPVDLEGAERALSPHQYSAVLRNLDVLRSILIESGVRWLDLSRSIAHEQFSQLYAPTEHLVLSGRNLVTTRISEAIRADASDGRPGAAKALSGTADGLRRGGS